MPLRKRVLSDNRVGLVFCDALGRLVKVAEVAAVHGRKMIWFDYPNRSADCLSEEGFTEIFKPHRDGGTCAHCGPLTQPHASR